MTVIVSALCAGAARDLPSGKRSGIEKAALAGAVSIGSRGIAGDVQVNREYHGYPPMALHHYPAENYAWLSQHFGPLPRLGEPGSMGENISTTGLTEHDVCIGDRFRLGSALIEVTQPRQPCSTIEQHLGARGIVKAIVASARSGWFYRVLEPGEAEAGMPLDLIERVNPAWPAARAFIATYGGVRGTNEELEELASVERVSDRLVRDIRKRLSA